MASGSLTYAARGIENCILGREGWYRFVFIAGGAPKRRTAAPRVAKRPFELTELLLCWTEGGRFLWRTLWTLGVVDETHRVLFGEFEELGVMDELEGFSCCKLNQDKVAE